MDFTDNLKNKFEHTSRSLDLEMDTEVLEESIIATVEVNQKIAKVKVPRVKHDLMEIDTLLIDTEDHRRYVSYETELDEKAFDIVLADTLIVAKKFLIGDYKTQSKRSLLGSRSNFVSFDVDDRYYTYSESK